jgi:SpoVK/Ycf46/Vps4 family AAA+-type ATPase
VPDVLDATGASAVTATNDQVLGLVDAYATNDRARFRSIVNQIKSHQKSLDADRAFAQAMAKIDRIPQEMTALSLGEMGLFSYSTPTETLDDLIVSSEIAAALDTILAQHRSPQVFLERRLPLTRKLLFVGPPGTGKTMSARVLANTLGLPLMRVALTSVIRSHLGETASGLAKLFEIIRRVRAVYLFDEFDALGASRKSGDDVSEMRRALNTLLQLIEDDDSQNLIIGTTNMPDLLDPALLRRFDELVEFAMPTQTVTHGLLCRLLGDLFVEEVCSNSLEGLPLLFGMSQADCAAAAMRVKRASALRNDDVYLADDLVAAIRVRRQLAAARSVTHDYVNPPRWRGNNKKEKHGQREEKGIEEQGEDRRQARAVHRR